MSICLWRPWCIGSTKTSTAATFSCKSQLTLKKYLLLKRWRVISDVLTCFLKLLSDFRPNLLDRLSALLLRRVMIVDLRKALHQADKLLVLLDLIWCNVMHSLNRVLMLMVNEGFLPPKQVSIVFIKFSVVSRRFRDVLPLALHTLALFEANASICY